MEKHSVTMKRLNYGEKVDLEEGAMDVKVVGNNPITKISTSKLRVLSILKSIVKSTFEPVSYDSIRSLPQDVGNLLFKTYTELNKQSPQ